MSKSFFAQGFSNCYLSTASHTQRDKKTSTLPSHLSTIDSTKSPKNDNTVYWFHCIKTILNTPSTKQQQIMKY